MARQPWHRQTGETKTAYAAFCLYRDMDAHGRSIDAAWRASKQDETSNAKSAPGHWRNWSADNAWVSRSTAYDEHLAEKDRILWEKRRAELRQRDWDQADELRKVVSDAIPHAQQFIRSKRTFTEGKDGNPDREIVTLNFDITGLTRVLVDASKLQRLATDEPTEHIKLSGAALDAAIAKELANLADGGQEGDADPFAEDESDGDGSSEGGVEEMPE